MFKLKIILSSILFLFILVLGILGWRAAMIFTDLSSMVADLVTELDSEIGARKTGNDEQTLSVDKSSLVTVNSKGDSNVDHYETISETIARIKRDVVVTGTVIGTPGQELAFFQIEGMADRPFKINTQLMDGFIITEISKDHVVLKNQSGDETIVLDLQGNNVSLVRKIRGLFSARVKLQVHDIKRFQPHEWKQRVRPYI